MGWQGQNFFPLLLVGASSGPAGVFVYSPGPGAGHLIASLSNSPVDPYGNTVQSTIASYSGASAVWLGGAAVRLTNGSENSPASILDGGGNLMIESPVASGGQLSAVLTLVPGNPGYVQAGSFVRATAPGGSAEAWHPIPLASGFTAVAGFATPSYRLNALGDLQLCGAVSGTIASGSQAFSTALPAGYFSATNAYAAASGLQSAAGGVSAGNEARVKITTGGVLQILGLGNGAAAWGCDVTLPISFG